MFPEIDGVKFFLSLSREHSRMCITIYISHFKIKQTNKKKRRRQKKAKETKVEKRISVENLTEYDDIVCEFALCTVILQQHF